MPTTHWPLKNSSAITFLFFSLFWNFSCPYSCADYIVTCSLHGGTFWFHWIDMPTESGEKRDYCWKSELTHSFRRHVNASVGCWQCLKTQADLMSYRQCRERRRSQFSLVSETLTHASCFTQRRGALTAPTNAYPRAHTKRNLLRCGCSNKTNADESSFSESLVSALLLEQSFWSYSGGCWAWHLALSGFPD